MSENTITFDIETTSLSAIDGQVTCICARTSDGKEFIDHAKDESDEERLILSFSGWLAGNSGYDTLISYNGKMFDVPFLLLRASSVYKTSSIEILRTDLTRRKHIDLIELIYGRISLSDMAILHGYKKSAMSGKVAISIFRNAVEERRKGNLEQSRILFEQLEWYCMSDVNVTEQIYLVRKKFFNETF